jgi:predicted DNA-binding protein
MGLLYNKIKTFICYHSLPFDIMVKTVQLGLRIEKELIDRIEDLAENEGVDKMAWIRRALASFVGDEEDEMADEAIKDYIKLRIDEKELLKFTEFRKVPEDIKEARKNYLTQIGERK